MHDNFRQPFGFYLRPGPNGGPGRGNFQGPPFGNSPWGAPPCVFSAPRGPPPAGFGQPLPLPWGNCPPNFDHSRFPRPSFNPPRGGHDFRGRGGFDAGGRGGCGFRGRGGGCNAGGRGGFDGRGRGTGAGSDYNFRGGGDFRGRGGFGGKGCFPPQGRGGQVSMPHEGFYAEKNKAKKVKTDKRDLPKNNVFRCDSCDRGFKTKDVFDKHVSEHQLCSYEGCEYIAAPKLIKIHIQCQHIETNVATQVWKSMSPQEIEQWKAERRKNFPTKDNIARKENERQERAARGELIDTRQFGKMRGRRGYRSRGGRWGGRGQGGHFMESRKRPAEEDQGGDESSAKRAAPDVSQESNSRKNPDARRSEALASLAAQYDASNSGDEDDAPEELDIAREAPSASNGATEQDQQKQKHHGCTPGGGGRAGAHKQGNVSLLEKLLAKDIRHERNVILQCVYFIVENNFFQPHQHSSALEEEEHAEQGRADGASPPPVSQAPTDSGYSSNPEPANNSAPLNGISNGDSHCSVEKEVPLDSAKETPVACEVGVCCQ